MKFIYLAFVFILSSINAFAQLENPDSLLAGKWKIQELNGDTQHNYDNNKTSYSKEFLQKLKGQKDSTFRIGLTKTIINNFENYAFEFTLEGKYKEYKDARVKQEGKYTINDSKNIIETNFFNRMGQPVTQKITYKIVNNKLVMMVPQRDKPIEITFVKVN